MWKIRAPWCVYIVSGVDGDAALALVQKTYASCEPGGFELVGSVDSDDGETEVVGVMW